MNNETLHNLIRTRRSGEDARRLMILAERLLSRLPPEMAAQLPPEDGLRMASAADEFLALRGEPLKLAIGHQTLGNQRVTVIQITLPDCAFIVDSIREYLHQRELLPAALLHPMFSVARDARGAITSFEGGSARERRESYTQAIIEGELDDTDMRTLGTDLRQRLTEVQAATTDFQPMSERALEICEEIAPARELVEVRDLLRWMVAGGWVFLGYQKYTRHPNGEGLSVDADSALGILRNPLRELGSLRDYDPALLGGGPIVIVNKCHTPSWVHRLDPMDEIVIRRTGHDGAPGCDRFLGLFTNRAAGEEARRLPLLRDKLRQILEAEKVAPGSHDYKELLANFNGLPKEELFRASAAELRAELSTILNAIGDHEVRVMLLPDPQRHLAVVMVLLPRARFSSQVGAQIGEVLSRRLSGQLLYSHLEMREGYSARLHFCFAVPRAGAPAAAELEDDVAALTRSWSDRLDEQLGERFGEDHGADLARRYARAFSPDYQATTDVAAALVDIQHLEAMLDGGRPEVVVRAPDSPAETGTAQIRIYQAGQRPVLSDLMPMLQNFGLRVLSEDVHEVLLHSEGQTETAFVLAFMVQAAQRANHLDLLARAEPLAQALGGVRGGNLENDPLNALVLSGGLSGRESALLRAYLAAAFQMRLGPAPAALRRIFLQQPPLARHLIEFFTARLNPAPQPSATSAEAAKAAFIDGLSAIDNLSDDRTARQLLAMVEATVRTNYFRREPTRDYISLKFESARIPGLGGTAPLYEIHVDSPLMQGCHLRAGKVARGGIRASDRLEDFRTEILALMKTQTVKNAIIVPVGAKGGFVLKREGPASREEVVAAYKTLINGMLDLTDNVVDGQVVAPPSVRVLDGNDPYLVVAADKGTADFSDIANGLALERGLWLSDAFASGGEHGYDHKKLGITARGAWESVTRHLREMGRDAGRGAAVTMVGIGDMSGDVFGNGLLQSANVKLLAAFDHRHIFLDPAPDPAASFAERKRLFEMTRSQWSDYDPRVLSPGGTIVRRGQKVIEISPEVRAALGIDAAQLDSDSLIRAILRADVDLLYNGGIGTFVRASDESDSEAGDHGNDACRITAGELRAKIVVEGGNLGFTQRARIEYALLGGRINTDAIDNSAGVDLSDHEVNLKILLQPALRRGALEFGDRNRALADAAPEVVEQVLRDNRDQVLLLSLEQTRSTTQAGVFREHLSAIEQRGLLRRGDEALPTREALHDRHSRFVGLTRPELAVLVAYTKLDLARQLEHAAFIDDPYLVERFLRPYFPPAIAQRFGAEIAQHQLRREIITTALVNQMVDLMGSIFVFGLVRDFDAGAEAAVKAFLVASDAMNAQARVARIKAGAQTLIAGADLTALLRLETAIDRATRAVLAQLPADRAIGAVIAELTPAFGAVADVFENHLAGGEQARFERGYRELRAAGLPEPEAHPLARLVFADYLIDVIHLSAAAAVPVADAAQAFFALAGAIDFALLDEALSAIGPQDRWERRAAQDLALELGWARVHLAHSLLQRWPEGGIQASGIGRLLARLDPRRFEKVEQVLAELRTLTALGMAPIGVAVREISRLAAAIGELPAAH